MSGNKKLWDLLPDIAVAVFLPFMVLIYAPFELLLTNRSDFWFTPGMLLPVALVLFAVSAAAVFGVLRLCRRINGKLYGAVYLAAIVAFICTYIQGSFFVSNLPVMDGKPVDWNAFPAERLKSIAVWVVFSAAAVFVLIKFGAERVRGICALGVSAIGLVLILTLTAVSLMAEDEVAADVLASTDKDLYQMSQSENFVILILDAVEASEFDWISEEPDNSLDTFEDFTYFSNTVGSYPFSKCAIQQIQTGRWYEAKQKFSEYRTSAIAESPILCRARAEDYRIGLYSFEDSRVLKTADFAGQFVNLLPDAQNIGSKTFAAKLLIKMSLIKYAPWDLKFLGYDLYGRLNESRVYDGDEGLNYFNDSNVSYYNRMQQDAPFDIVPDKCFKLIHLEGAHEPYDLDTDFNHVENGSYQDKLRCSIKTAGAYLDALKRNGIYDNSVILIMSDHGYSVGYEGANLQQHPILLIKGKNEHHAVRTSEAPVSYDDLQEAFGRLMDGCAGEEAFDCREGEPRERRFMNYDAVNTNYFEEFVQTGDAGDMTTLIPTGRVFEKSY